VEAVRRMEVALQEDVLAFGILHGLLDEQKARDSGFE